MDFKFALAAIMFFAGMASFLYAVKARIELADALGEERGASEDCDCGRCRCPDGARRKRLPEEPAEAGRFKAEFARLQEENKALREELFESSPTIDELEARALGDLLKIHGGDRAAAARAIGLSEQALGRKMRRHGIGEGNAP
jgi:DNA-binding NtrC family response regulator